MSKSKPIIIPGVLGDVSVYVVTRATIFRHLGLSLKQAAKQNKTVNGLYINEDMKIYIARELDNTARLVTLYHELSHMILDATEHMEDETRCDVIGLYISKLINDPRIKIALVNVTNSK